MSEDLRIAFDTARKAADSLRAVHVALADRFPWTPESLEESDEITTLRREGLLLRYANLVNTLVEHVFRLIAEEEGLPRPRRTSRRDMLDDMEALGVVRDADLFFDIIGHRNRLSHVYPGNPAAQAGQVNRVQASVPDLLAALDSAEAWARSKGYLPG